jgi:hypothetical protein
LFTHNKERVKQLLQDLEFESTTQANQKVVRQLELTEEEDMASNQTTPPSPQDVPWEV